MFEDNPYKIPSDKFEYIRTIMLEHGVTIDLQRCDSNPFLNIPNCQEHRDLRVKYREAEPRKISITSFEHHILALHCRDVVGSIYFSSDVKNRDSYEQKLPASQKALYNLVIHLWYLYPGWRYVLNDQIYLWAESNNTIDFLDTDYLCNRFEYDKNNLHILIEIFGEDTIIDIMNYFPGCPKCGGGR